MEHIHSHDHCHETNSPEERLALLRYMAEHNKHHAQELHELSHNTDGEAKELLHEAVEALKICTEKTEKAIEILEEK